MLEGIVVIHGLEAEFVNRFRKLTAAQTKQVLDHLSFVEAVGKEGAREERESFRRKGRTG